MLTALLTVVVVLNARTIGKALDGVLGLILLVFWWVFVEHWKMWAVSIVVAGVLVFWEMFKATIANRSGGE